MNRTFLVAVALILAGCGEGVVVDDVCVPMLECVPSCPVDWCGDDGCGCPCPSCADGLKCRDDQCVCGVCGGECGECPVLEWMDVTGAQFTMGCVADAANVDKICESNNLPPHNVTMQDYQAGRFEITVTEYNACVATGACLAAGDDSGCNGSKTNMLNHPINCVTWDDADSYCMWAGGRLGSEAEWEFAARGTDGRKYPWGSQGPACNLAWTNLTNCPAVTTGEVGLKPLGKSPFGCEDMAGNVSEWVTDPCHIESYAGAPVDGSVWTMDDPGNCRVNRGGGFTDGVEATRAYSRRFSEKDKSSKTLGIRCFR